MTRGQTVAVAPSLVLFVYFGATTTDTHVWRPHVRGDTGIGISAAALRRLRVPYAVLTFQIVSTLLSGFLVLTLGPVFLDAVARGSVDTRDWFIPTYLLVQTLAGIAAVPVWRRLSRSASNDRADVRLRLSARPSD